MIYSYFLHDSREPEELSFNGKEENITILRLENLSNTRSVNLENLKLLNILTIQSNITSISNFPLSLKKLAIASEAITQLPEFNDGLEHLVIENCPALTQLPQLPQSLKSLRIGNSSISTLPSGFPLEDNNLEHVDLKYMNGLETNLENFNKLLKLEEMMTRKNLDCSNIWPDQFDKHKYYLFLTQAYCDYRRNDPNFSVLNFNANPNFPTYFLIHRFVNEATQDRGDKIIPQANQFTKKIYYNPAILETLDEVASGFLEGCINQPVAGFVEIATLVDIDECQSIEEKLQKSKILLAINEVKNSLANFKDSHGNAVGQEVEVELFNALLIRVHRKLHQQNKIDQEWWQIPTRIKHEGTIATLLNEEKINELVEKIDHEILQMPLTAVANFMCETANYQDFWATQVLTKQVRDEIAQPFKDLKERYSQLDEFSPSQIQKLNQVEVRCHSQKLRTAKQVCFQKLGIEIDLELSQRPESRSTSIDSIRSQANIAESSQGIDESSTRPATTFNCIPGITYSLFSRCRRPPR